MPDVTALGELLIDFAPAGTDEHGYPMLNAQPGGAPANFLAALTRYGARTALLGKVGRDAFGDLLVKTLDEAGIETRGILRDPSVFTTLAFVTLNEHGERAFSFARKPGADTMLRPEELELSLIDDAGVFHFGSLSLTDEPARSATRAAVAYARERGKLITYDPNLRSPLWDSLEEAAAQMRWGLRQADVVKISHEEVRFLFDTDDVAVAAQSIRAEYGVKLVFITLGKDGCYYSGANAAGRIPGVAGIHPTDTTGAGDIFGGAAVAGILAAGKPLEGLTEEELRGIAAFACTAASLSTQRPGGIFSVPDRAAVEAWMRGGPSTDFDREAFMARIGLPEAAREVVRSADIPISEFQAWSSLFNADEAAFLKMLEQQDDPIWNLRFFIAAAGQTYGQYRARQIEDTIFFDTLSDVTLWCAECFRQRGVYGLTEIGWIAKSVKLKLFRLGRLQFEPQTLQTEFAGAEHSFPKGTEYLYVHIPADDSLLREDCLDSFRRADSFFGAQYKCFLCDSWLLSPALKEILPPESNILRFQALFDLTGTDETNSQAEARIFGNVRENKALYPEDTSLQNRAKRLLLSGKRLGIGTGLRLRTAHKTL